MSAKTTSAIRHRPWWLTSIRGTALLAALLIGVCLLVDSVGSKLDQSVATTFLIFAVAVVGIQVFVGLSGVISFGHVAFMALGAYATALLTTDPAVKRLDSFIPNAPEVLLSAHMGFVPATAIAAAFVGVVALVIGLAIVRLSESAAAIATFGLLVIVRVVLSNLDEVTRGTQTYFGVPHYTTLWSALAFAIVAILVARLFRDSSFGLRLRATRNDTVAGEAMGVDLFGKRLAAWVLSAMIAAAGGALLAHHLLAFAPKTFFLDLMFVTTVMVIIGGPTISGAVAGAALMTVVTEFLRRQENGFSVGPITVDQAFGLTTIAVGVVVIAVLIRKPTGLLGRWELDELLARWQRSRTAKAAHGAVQPDDGTTRGARS